MRKFRVRPPVEGKARHGYVPQPQYLRRMSRTIGNGHEFMIMDKSPQGIEQCFEGRSGIDDRIHHVEQLPIARVG